MNINVTVNKRNKLNSQKLIKFKKGFADNFFRALHFCLKKYQVINSLCSLRKNLF